MQIKPTGILGLLIIQPEQLSDERGYFSETFREDKLAEFGFTQKFIQDNHICSSEPYVLRGLHFQSPPYAQDKLLRVTKGSIYDVAVDIRLGSPTYGKWVGIELSEKNFTQLLVPAGFAHGYLTLMPDTEVIYKVSNVYSPNSEKGLMWDDPDLEIDWPLNGNTPQLSRKDKKQVSFGDFNSPFSC